MTAPKQQEKKCPACEIVKATSEFNKNRSAPDGLQNQCRVCSRKRNRAYRQHHAAQVRERGKRWRKQRPEYSKLRRAKVQAEEPERAEAWQVIQLALRHGEMVRAERCNRCDRATGLEAHHADYTKPLEVEWLCARCHRRHHAEEVVDVAA